MKYLSNYSKKISVGLITLAFAWSCSKDESPAVSSGDTANVQGESVTDSYYDESNDFSTIAVGGTAATQTGRTENGRTTDEVKGLGDIDNRLACAVVTIVKDPNSTPDKPIYKGTITIDFKDGCTDAKGNIRKGKIIVTYNGRRFALNSTIVTTFSNYSVNGIKIEGTNKLTNLTTNLETSPKFKNEVIGGKVTFTDGKVATRDHVLTREWIRGANPSQDSWKVEGSATGTTREEVTYQMEITKALVYKRSCVASKVFVAVEGTKKFTSGDKTMTIDFGAGDCDNKVTVTVNGVSKEIEIKADGSNS